MPAVSSKNWSCLCNLMCWGALVLIGPGCDPGDDGGPRADLRCLDDERPEGFSVYIRECSVGSCSDGQFCNGFETCRGRGEDDAFICSCSFGPEPCNRTQFCDEENDECVGGCDGELDADGDGSLSIECGGNDCDDEDAGRFPGNTEVCDEEGVDEDCDPSTFGEEDRDGDGFVDAACFNVDEKGDEVRGADCDDGEPSVHPLQVEVCNGVDDDCDGDVDEELLVPLYLDEDGDGYGVGEPTNQCSPVAGFSSRNGDCDDELATIHPDAMRCVPGGQGVEYEICQPDGTWESDLCPLGATCYPQPDGTGVCL